MTFESKVKVKIFKSVYVVCNSNISGEVSGSLLGH